MKINLQINKMMIKMIKQRYFDVSFRYSRASWGVLGCPGVIRLTRTVPVNRSRDVNTNRIRRDVPVGVPLDLSTPTGMSCIGTYGDSQLIIYFISYFPKIRNSYGNSRCFEYIGSNQIQY